MKRSGLSVCALALAAAATVLPAVAAADPYDHHYGRHHQYHHYHHYSRYDRGCHERHSTNGTIIGALGGGLVGGALAHGNALPAVALGAGVGALAGHAIGARSGC